MIQKENADDRKILVAFADDHTTVRKTVAAFLTGLGGIEVVVQAANGKELIDAIETLETKPDVAVLDINMPVMNGFETVQMLKERWENIKILVLTTFMDELYVCKMIRYGANGYLSKDCDPEEIKRALVAIKEQGMYYSDFFVEKMAVVVKDKKKEPRITERELQFMKHCISDLTYFQIASLMKTTQKSVEGYRDSLFRKLGVNSRVGLAVFAIKSGLVTIDTMALPIRH
ncbi:response regulator transcription factor [Taibaiella koreensis]|uniref:response regulator transcription factor n=1 Tax=Taibaiella koreensis TaxID=1268548 RepID=UPI000E59DB3D|nr:response regulator transcription factor [Taibaiella koreensis]